MKQLLLLFCAFFFSISMLSTHCSESSVDSKISLESSPKQTKRRILTCAQALAERMKHDNQNMESDPNIPESISPEKIKDICNTFSKLREMDENISKPQKLLLCGIRNCSATFSDTEMRKQHWADMHMRSRSLKAENEKEIKEKTELSTTKSKKRKLTSQEKNYNRIRLIPTIKFKCREKKHSDGSQCDFISAASDLKLKMSSHVEHIIRKHIYPITCFVVGCDDIILHNEDWLKHRRKKHELLKDIQDGHIKPIEPLAENPTTVKQSRPVVGGKEPQVRPKKTPYKKQKL